MKSAEQYLKKVSVKDVIGISADGIRTMETDMSLARYILHRAHALQYDKTESAKSHIE